MQNLKNKYTALSASEKIALWSLCLSACLGFASLKSTSSSENALLQSAHEIPKTPVVINSDTRAMYANQLMPKEILDAMAQFSTDSGRLNYLQSIKDNIAVNFCITDIIDLLDLMETDSSKLHALKSIEGNTDKIFPENAKLIAAKFDDDSSMNAAHTIINKFNRAQK